MSTAPPIRVGIADDHAMVREGLRVFLELAADIVVVGVADSGQSAVDMLLQTDVDVVLMDLWMPGEIGGLEAIRRIAELRPSVRVLVLTSSQSASDIRMAMSHGAIGYLQKDVQPDELASAIRQAYAGRGVLEFAALDALRHAVYEPDSPGMATGSTLVTPLTPREQSVLEQLAKGLSNKEIADFLHIAEKTVKVHISHILGKLQVYDRTQAVIVASKMGLVSL